MVIVGLAAFGVVFALNSTVHSYLILAYADRATGRDERGLLLHGERGRPPRGTVLSGLLYQWQGLEACLWASAALVLVAGLLSLLLPRRAGQAVPRWYRGRVSTAGEDAP